VLRDENICPSSVGGYLVGTQPSLQEHTLHLTRRDFSYIRYLVGLTLLCVLIGKNTQKRFYIGIRINAEADMILDLDPAFLGRWRSGSRSFLLKGTYIIVKKTCFLLSKVFHLHQFILNLHDKIVWRLNLREIMKVLIQG